MRARRHVSALTAFLVTATAALALAGCGSAGAPPDTARTGPAPPGAKRAYSARQRAQYFARIREAVVRGAGRDFAAGTGIGGASFEGCVRASLRRRLDRPTITRLVQVYRRPGGQPFAAQALNALAAPLAASCGHRTWVPELVQASRALSSGKLVGRAVERLGVTYGPYLGIRCRQLNRVACERVGIDVVLGQAATAVVAVAGERRIRLRTPGMHSGVRHRDWVGTFTRAGISRPDSPFRLRGDRRRFWGGSPAIYAAVELRVRFADGRRVSARFPHVFLSPGWG
jgi:hypothetical protein